MSVVCWLFGHSQVRMFSDFSSMGGGEYATDVHGPREDGIHRQHFDLIAQCPRCGERYLACKIHGHWITDLLPKEQQEADNGQ